MRETGRGVGVGWEDVLCEPVAKPQAKPQMCCDVIYLSSGGSGSGSRHISACSALLGLGGTNRKMRLSFPEPLHLCKN